MESISFNTYIYTLLETYRFFVAVCVKRVSCNLSTCAVNISSLNNSNFKYYIAGLVEGDGSIKLPRLARVKGKLRYPSITIVFALKDKPLAEALAPLLKGKVNSSKGNYVVLSIQNLEGIYSFAVMVNGLFRTPKINDLCRLID
jgi:hypothetical protein